EVAELATEDLNPGEQDFDVVNSLLRQAILERDPGWKAFYNEKMNELETSSKDYHIYDILEKERAAEEYLYMGNPEKAADLFQDIVDNNCESEDEEGWYLQQMARATYLISKSNSNRIQKGAFKKNRQLLKPQEGVSYKKVEFIDQNRIKNIKNWMQKFESFDDLMLEVNGLFSNLSFGMPAEKFESALKEIGNSLGFASERPDKENKTGPDNLWCGTSNRYIIFECKSEVKKNRNEISKSEASQMNTHSAWFVDIYGDAPVTRILIIPTNDLSRLGDFTHKVVIMRKDKLNLLQTNVTSFFKEFRKYELASLSEEKINHLLTTHNLQMNNLEEEYSEDYYKRR